MSPEQALGQKLDHRADIYSVGVMLFEIFTGQVPFKAESFMGILSQHITKPTPKPSTMSPGRTIPIPIEDIILKAMAKEADHRYGSMRELQAALQEIYSSLGLKGAVRGPAPRTMAFGSESLPPAGQATGPRAPQAAPAGPGAHQTGPGAAPVDHGMIATQLESPSVAPPQSTTGDVASPGGSMVSPSSIKRMGSLPDAAIQPTMADLSGGTTGPKPAVIPPTQFSGTGPAAPGAPQPVGMQPTMASVPPPDVRGTGALPQPAPPPAAGTSTPIPKTMVAPSMGPQAAPVAAEAATPAEPELHPNYVPSLPRPITPGTAGPLEGGKKKGKGFDHRRGGGGPVAQHHRGAGRGFLARHHGRQGPRGGHHSGCHGHAGQGGHDRRGAGHSGPGRSERS